MFPALDFRVKIEQTGCVVFVVQHPFAHERQVGIGFPCAARKEQFSAKAIDVPIVIDVFIFGNGLTKPLRKVRMSLGPVKDSLKQSIADFRLPPQATSQRSGFGCGEIMKLYAMTDVEWG